MKHLLLLLTFLIFTSSTFAQDNIEDSSNAVVPQHAISLHGEPKYGSDFEHLSYVNPNAPKGGSLKMSAIGSFDSLNPFIVKGTPAAGMNFLRSGFVYQSLMQNSWDEPFTLYGILAETIEVGPERDWVAFNLRPEAKWADGKPVSADDVVWTFNTLMEHGQPFFKAYYGDVKSVTAENDKRVKFEFAVKGNAELPLIVAEIAVLPKHFWTDENNPRDFNKTSLEAPLGSGPYTVGAVDAGRSVEYIRRDDWWGEDLPFFKGFYNFERVTYDYYRDANVALEAFLANEYDVKIENTAKLWESAYNVPALEKGDLIKEEIGNTRPAGMQAFIYNTRRDVFKDKAVREALNYAFDFEWSNKQFAFGAYVRTDSFYENSELASSGLPEGAELELLKRIKEQHPKHVPDEVFTQTYTNPATDGSGRARQNFKTAMKILDDAGWILGEDGIRSKDGVRLEFEIVDSNPLFERWVLPFVKNLKRIGAEANFRVVDTAQYQNRMSAFDFDMTVSGFGQSNSPGNEQRDFWGSEKANVDGSRNYIGVQNPAIDQIIEELIVTQSREDLITHIRALDRILLAEHFVIPMWHFNKWRIAYWSHIARPDPLSGISPLITDTWWAKSNQQESSE
ncbi:MAG: extracellular solute-binding protein [Bdellovibrionales bacterium]